jgi:hypothetical protein
MFILAFAVLLAPAWQPVARAGESSEQLVDDYLQSIGATAYMITPIDEEYVANTFPGIDFFEVVFRQYPIAVRPPQGLSSADIFLVLDGTVYHIATPTGLINAFFYAQMHGLMASVVGTDGTVDENLVTQVGLTYLRLTQVFSLDGFFQFNEPSVNVTTDPFTGNVAVTGSVTVVNQRGDNGEIDATLEFNADGTLDDISETRNVIRGIRPICQATKLLDKDSLVRRMAEQDILVMGRSCKKYLDEQRAKAKGNPELQKAIDRIWKRIVDEGR